MSSAYKTNGDYTFELAHTEEKYNKNSDNNGIYEGESGIDVEKKVMTRTLDQEFQDSPHTTRSKCNSFNADALLRILILSV